MFDFLTIGAVLLCFLGTVVGIIFGFLPGLSATMGVALMMPFTFGMPLVNSMALLLGVYCGGIYGGSITAILIRTPGTPASAATVLDGYPLTQQGLAKRALDTATLSSLLGGLFSCVILILLARRVANFALSFGNAEYFAVGIFGLSMVTALSSKNIRKGIVSCILGFMLSTIGLDSLSGATRFTLGNIYMMAGIETVTALVGLFAISEFFSKLQGVGKKGPDSTIAKYGGKGMHIFDLVKNHWGNLLRSSIIGTIVGIIPATGSGTAGWISYNEAKRASKDPDSFGKGNVDGIIASESSNNAVTGGALIPLLTLGVPGDTVTAVLLGALMLQGITPGPMLFVQRPDEVNTIYVLMILANVFFAILGVTCVPLFVKVLKVPSSALMAGVLALCCIGAFAVRGYVFDIQCALVLAIVGYLFNKTDYPIPPVLLGLLLGKTIESNFRRAMTQTDGDWTVFFTRPICCALLVISIAAFCWPIVKAIIDYVKRVKAAKTAKAE